MLCATPSSAQTVAVMVNGEPITNFDIEQRSKLNFLSTHKPQVRKQVIDELIDEKIKIREGKKYSIDPSSSDIDGLYAGMSSAMHITPDQLTKSLASPGIRPETLKQRIRAEMVWSAWSAGGSRKASRSEKRTSLPPPRADEKPDKADTESFEYKMQPIVSDCAARIAAGRDGARRKEAETLRNRIQTCDEANALFKSMQNAAIRDAVTKTSADLPAALRELLDKTPIGHLTEPEVTKQGVEMVALCSRTPTTVDTPRKRKSAKRCLPASSRRSRKRTCNRSGRLR